MRSSQGSLAGQGSWNRRHWAQTEGDISYVWVSKRWKLCTRRDQIRRKLNQR